MKSIDSDSMEFPLPYMSPLSDKDNGFVSFPTDFNVEVTQKLKMQSSKSVEKKKDRIASQESEILEFSSMKKALKHRVSKIYLTL